MSSPAGATRRNLQSQHPQRDPRKEVTTMNRQLRSIRIFSPKPVRSEKTQFNAQLLEQRREDIFLAMHQMGLIR
jgi:hypothetical protein